MNNEQCGTEAKVRARRQRRNAPIIMGICAMAFSMRRARILEEQSLSALTLRAVAQARRGQPCGALSPFPQS